MSFVIYDLSFLVIFTLVIVFFLYKRKQRLVREGPMYLYKTKVGLKVIDNIANKNKKLLSFISPIMISIGYVLMIVMMYLLIRIIWIFSKPELVQIIKIPPLMPLIPYIGEVFKVTWLPPFYFTYWIIAIAIVAIVHEGFHGIYARLSKIRIKSTGFGFLGPFLAFFVEQDDNDMKKRKIAPQLSVISAGVFSNLIVGIIFLILMAVFFQSAYVSSGIIVSPNNYAFSYINKTQIQMIAENITTEAGLKMNQVIANNKSYLAGITYLASQLDSKENSMLILEDKPAVRNFVSGVLIEINGEKIKSYQGLERTLERYKPGDKIGLKVETINGTIDYEIILDRYYDDSGRADIGIRQTESIKASFGSFMSGVFNAFRDNTVAYTPKGLPDLTDFVYYLLWWLVLINFSIALVNMLPVAIFDGGRFFYLTVLAITRREKIAEKAFKIMTYIILAIFVLVMLLWAKAYF